MSRTIRSAFPILAAALLVGAVLLPCPPARAGDDAEPVRLAHNVGQQDPQQQILDTLHERLRHFADGWLSKLKRNQLCGPGNCEVNRSADGRYVASYEQIVEGQEPVCLVRASTFQPGAYIGSILYKVAVYQSVGDTPQQARSGPFNPAEMTTHNEIFSIANKDAAWNGGR